MNTGPAGDLTSPAGTGTTKNDGKRGTRTTHGRRGPFLARLRRDWQLLLMALPAIGLLVVFHYVPLLGNVIAFQDYSPYVGFRDSPWVGLSNFQWLLLDERFADVRRCRTALADPAGPWVQRLRHHDQPGHLPRAGHRGDGLEGRGLGAIIFLAALAAINQNLYEAAAVDGASRWRRLWHITLPGLRPVIILLLILRLGEALNVGFEQFFLQRDAVGRDAAEVLDTFVYWRTLLTGEWSHGSAAGLVTVPGELSFAAYAELFSGGVVTRSVLVSLGVTLVGTAISLTVTVLASYGLSRPGSLLHKPMLFLILLTFLFGPGLIPNYLLVSSLGLIDTYWSLILPGAVTAFNLVVMRAFFMNIPAEVSDSARIDGASEFHILRKIVLPMSKGVTAVIGLFYAVGYWNSFFNAVLYLNDNAKLPLQVVLRQYVLQGQSLFAGQTGDATVAGQTLPPSLALQMAIVVVALLPVLFVYPFVQRHFTKGVIIGAVKG
ncbi:ABC-type polysaccharide transport system permease subunit [Streptosporangium album]|uniref:ABC-type polysaccharide transport system permease subunit n=2 Tax=Streptosporangium album TaxID=47479 RepID=A0A7W7RWY8_9ACTN|nr:ABC-type polysaccharide transport system permease subunit [Streptosporangium album]